MKAIIATFALIACANANGAIVLTAAFAGPPNPTPSQAMFCLLDYNNSDYLTYHHYDFFCKDYEALYNLHHASSHTWWVVHPYAYSDQILENHSCPAGRWKVVASATGYKVAGGMTAFYKEKEKLITCNC